MRPGGGKHKGAQWERQVCQLLSLWVSQGRHKDLYWRSAMSGGRASIHQGDVRQAGDVCAVTQEGHSLTDRYYIECKHVRDLCFDSFVLKGKGLLADFWSTARREAKRYDKSPMLIARQNNMPALLLTTFPPISGRALALEPCAYIYNAGNCRVYLLQDVLEKPYDAHDLGDSRPTLIRKSQGRLPVRVPRKATKAA